MLMRSAASPRRTARLIPRLLTGTRLGRDESGVSAIEFALVMPLMLLLLLGGVEYSLLLYTKNSVQHAARDTVRQLSIGHITDANAIDHLCGSLPSWVQGHCSVTVTHTHPTDLAKDVITVSVTVPASQASITNFLTPKIGDFDMTTEAVMKRENVL